MMKLFGKKISKTTFGKLKVGDCFFDDGISFCIKVNNSSCLILDKETWWEVCGDYSASDEVFPVDTEIHIVS